MSELTSILYFILIFFVRLALLPLAYSRSALRGSQRLKDLKQFYKRSKTIWTIEKLFLGSVLAIYYENAMQFFSGLLFVKSPFFGMTSFIFAVLRGSILLYPVYFYFKFEETEQTLRECAEQILILSSRKRLVRWLGSYTRDNHQIRPRDFKPIIELIFLKKLRGVKLGDVQEKLGKWGTNGSQ